VFPPWEEPLCRKLLVICSAQLLGMNWKFRSVLTTTRQENECSKHLKYLDCESGRVNSIFFVTFETESDFTQLIRNKTFGRIYDMREW
jgi:hypothetical protein